MLLTILSLLDMYGSVIPPVPVIPPSVGGGGGGFGGEIMKDERLEAMEKRRKINNDLAIILASWLTNKNR